MTTWKETTEERFWDMLGCVPPAVQTFGGFLVGEAYDHNSAGVPTFHGFIEKSGKFYEADTPMTIADFKIEAKTFQGKTQ